MINDVSISYLIFLMPLIVFAVNGLFLGRKSDKAAEIFAVIGNGIAMISALIIAVHYFGSTFAPQKGILFDIPFLKFGESFKANIGLLIDPLSVMMLVVVTVISFLVNIYSIGYMRGDRSRGRFFALLSLFSFSTSHRPSIKSISSTCTSWRQ